MSQWLAEHVREVVGVLYALAAADLLVALGLVLAHRRRRMACWLDQPQRLVALQQRSSPVWAVLVAVAFVACAGAAMFHLHAALPPAVLLAAFACLVAGHVCRWSWASGLGMVFVGQAVTSGVLSWWDAGWLGGVIGLGLSSLYLLWLGRFWRQQLRDGAAWTTTGRMIPIVRRVGFVGVAGTLAILISGLAGLGAHSVGLAVTWLVAVVVANTTAPTPDAEQDCQVQSNAQPAASLSE